MTTKTLDSNPEFFKRLGHNVVTPFDIKQDEIEQLPPLGPVATDMKLYNRELYRLRASPFVDPFQDELVIQEKTISIIRRQPFVSSTETITVKDIGRVVYVNGIIFGRLEVLGKNTAHDLKINGLNKQRGLKAKKIIEGLVLEDQSVIEMPDWIQTEAHREMLEGIGVDPNQSGEQSNKSHQDAQDRRHIK